MSEAIGIIFGGPSPEHDVSVLTGLQASHELLDRGRAVTALYWAKNGTWWSVDPHSEARQLADGPPENSTEVTLEAGWGVGFTQERRFGRRTSLPIEAVINCCHGGPGEDGTLQAVLNLAGIPYTGPSHAAAAAGMDKYAFGALVADQSLPTLPRFVYRAHATTRPTFPPPYIVKPRYGGSSIGIEVAADYDAVEALASHSVHLRDGAVVEPYLEGAVDLNVAIRSFPVVELSAVERPLRTNAESGFLGFEDKYTAREGMAGAPRELPAMLEDGQRETIERCARVVAELLPVRGICRLDFLSHDGNIYVNEVNTIPGSFAKYLWIDPKIDFHTLLQDMIDESVKVPASRPHVTTSDGDLLRAAVRISEKLR